MANTSEFKRARLGDDAVPDEEVEDYDDPSKHPNSIICVMFASINDKDEMRLRVLSKKTYDFLRAESKDRFILLAMERCRNIFQARMYFARKPPCLLPVLEYMM
jgi:hypothetical protein